MQVLSIEQVAAKTQLAVSTIYEKVREGCFPAPIPLGGSRRGFLENEIDRWIEACAAERTAPPIPNGRAQFWEDVRAGRRDHPRTAGRLRREAAESAAQWIVVIPGDDRSGQLGPYPSEEEAKRVADMLKADLEARVERLPATSAK